MCGIAGIVGPVADRATLSNMLVKQQHRGPDYTGIWTAENVALGHNRLSIIDLSDEANQPFTNEESRYILIFNGEVYNYLEIKEELKSKYEFKTSSDTEVLLYAYEEWGEQCLDKLNGMFSFAIGIKGKKYYLLPAIGLG